jgi:hypothetical protein
VNDPLLEAAQAFGCQALQPHQDAAIAAAEANLALLHEVVQRRSGSGASATVTPAAAAVMATEPTTEAESVRRGGGGEGAAAAAVCSVDGAASEAAPRSVAPVATIGN